MPFNHRKVTKPLVYGSGDIRHWKKNVYILITFLHHRDYFGVLPSTNQLWVVPAFHNNFARIYYFMNNKLL